MFTWICPKCGREVGPAYNECPDCAAAGKLPAAPLPGGELPATALPPQSAPVAQPAQPAYQPQHAVSPMFQAPAAVQPQYAPRPAGTQVPTWLLAILIALVLVGLGGGVVWYFSNQRAQKPTAVVESPAAQPGTAQNPLQKYIEITGVRFSKISKGVAVTFLLVNHSDSDLVGLSGNVTLWGSTQKSEEDGVGTLSFQASLPAQGSKELTLPFTTKLKLGQIPQWQNITADLQITSGQAVSDSPAPR